MLGKEMEAVKMSIEEIEMVLQAIKLLLNEMKLFIDSSGERDEIDVETVRNAEAGEQFSLLKQSKGAKLIGN